MTTSDDARQPEPGTDSRVEDWWLYAAKAGWRPRILRVGTVVH